MKTTRCYQCGTLIGFDDVTYEALKTNGKTFMCPIGHAQAFVVEPSPDKARIADLERLVARREREIEDKTWWRCAWCDKRVRVCGIQEHLTRRHGFPGVREVRAAMKALKKHKAART